MFVSSLRTREKHFSDRWPLPSTQLIPFFHLIRFPLSHRVSLESAENKIDFFAPEANLRSTLRIVSSVTFIDWNMHGWKMLASSFWINSKKIKTNQRPQ